MPNKIKDYIERGYSEEEILKMRNAQRRRNYQKGRKGCYLHQWTAEENKMVLERKLSDRQLSRIIKHSVQAIQTRRNMLKNKEGEK